MLAWAAVAMSATSLLLIALVLVRSVREDTDAEQVAWLEKPDP